MSNNNLINHIMSMKATDVVRDEQVRDKFIGIYNDIWGEGGEGAYARESIYFNQIMREKADLRLATPISTYCAFIDLAVKGLSLASGKQALCYLTTRYTVIGKDEKGNKIKERHCNLTISGYGELFLRKNAGQIKYADNPTVVYDGDFFEHGERNGQKFVNYTAKYPRASNKIIACFLKITRADGSIDYSVMEEGDWKRLQDYSQRNNSYYDQHGKYVEGKANDLYDVNGQIDPGFLCAKCVKHAFRTYPKLRIGKGSSMLADAAEREPEEDYYGIPQQQPKAFGPETNQGVRYQPAQETAPTATDAAPAATEKEEGDGAF